MRRNINWVLDADIRGCFDAIDHAWLIKFVEHLIADKRVVRHLEKWLKAGIREGDELRENTEGTPQGESVSPLLCNIYLHYGEHTSRTKIGQERSYFGAWQGGAELFMNKSG
jgi:retron-type reverse transcriptase